MNVEHMFKDMLEFQDQTNQYLTDDVDGDWRSLRNKWYRAIWIECAELSEHYGNWKWWKGAQTPDIDQCFLECVDIWHFAMSVMLEKEKTVDGVIDSHHYRSLLSFLHTDQFVPEDEDKKHEMFHVTVESIASDALHHSFDMNTFMYVIHLLGKDFDDLFKWYVGKNVLNLFRNDHGYANGTYKKTWPVNEYTSMEDNEHLANIVNTIDVKFYPRLTDMKRDIYGRLKERYNVALLVRGVK